MNIRTIAGSKDIGIRLTHDKGRPRNEVGAELPEDCWRRLAGLSPVTYLPRTDKKPDTGAD